MKKQLFTAVLVSAMVVSLMTGCSKTPKTASTEAKATEKPAAAAETKATEAPAATAVPEVKAATASADIADYAGTYTDTSDGSELTFKADGTMSLGLFRLTEQAGKVEKIENGVIYVTMTDASGNPMKATFTPASGTFEITDSTWEYLKNGDTYTFTKK